MAEIVTTKDNLTFLIRPETIDREIIKSVKRDYASLPVTPSDIVLDIGAHIGIFSIRAAKKASFVYSYEPSRENCQYLDMNLRSNDIENCSWYNKAVVGNLDRTRSLNINIRKNSGGHTLIPKMRGDAHSQIVECTNINDIISDKKPTIVKMDCEGSEYEIIRGIKSFGAIRALTLEWHSTLLKDGDDSKLNEIVNKLSLHFGKVKFKATNPKDWYGLQIIICIKDGDDW